MKNVLIVSGTGDAHAEYMCKLMDSLDISYFLFLTDKYPFESQLTLDFSRGYVLIQDERQVIINEEWNIWNRRIFDPSFPKEFPKNLEEMVKEEVKRTLQGLMITHKGKVVNNPINNHFANNKIEQLQRARNIGLLVPETIVTNNPEDARRFYYEHNGDVIFKMQKLPVIEEDSRNYKTIMTSRVLPEHLKDVDRVRNAPCCFQERINKEYEVRLTVVGDKLFSVAIYSQDSEISRDDFRRYDFENVKYKLVDLPDEIKIMISKLTSQYKLHYAAIDLIRTPKGEYFFLEINPNGQYLWTEEMSGVPITETFAIYLSE